MASASSAPPDPSKTLISRLDTAARRGSPQAIPLELLNETLATLAKQAALLTNGGVNIENTLFNDPFTLLALLLPAVSASPARHEQSAALFVSIAILARHSSAKEVVLAAGEQVDKLKLPEDTDEEDEWNAAHDGEAWSAPDAAMQLRSLLDMYTLALPRIQTKRPLTFLTPAIEPVCMSICHVLFEGAFREPELGAPGTGQGGVDEVAIGMFGAVGRFLQVITEGIWLDVPGEDFRIMGVALCSALAQETVGYLHPFVPQYLACDFFYSRFPHYRRPGAVPEISEKAKGVWADYVNLLPALNLPPHHLFTGASSSFGTPHTAIGSLVLLAHHLAAHPSTPVSALSHPDRAVRSPGELLRKTFRVLKMSFDNGGMTRMGEDEMLFWMWWCVEKQVEEGQGEGFEDEVLFPLVEILSTLSATSPAPQTRFLSYRLLSRLLLTCCTPPASPPCPLKPPPPAPRDRAETTQLVLLKGLVVESPSEPLRTAAVGLVKEVIEQKLAEAEKAPLDAPPSLFLSPVFLSEFSTLFLPLAPSPSSSSDLPLPSAEEAETKPLDELAPNEFVQLHYASVMARLGLYFFLVRRDRGNRTGLLTPSVLSSHSSHSLLPLRRRFDNYLSPSPPLSSASSLPPGSKDKQEEQPVELDPHTRFSVEMARDMVGRVEEAVEEARRRGREGR
ncbi:hypothetical protein JCM8097_008961 [Rhodosporidiobolus ruineniae]